ncbi:glycosyltransferase [Vibrio campbellii]|nr:glycosyltransferase [Vibrio campbellii]MCC4226127.1 glycosyltransferase [Vibrio campbellii]
MDDGLNVDMILFIRSTAINPDTRLEKYINYCKSKNIDYHILGWMRKGDEPRKDLNISYFKLPASYGGGVKNILYLVLWFIFVFYNTFLLRKKIEFIHACDLDGMIGCTPFFNKIRVNFDVFDSYPESRFKKNSLIFNLSKRLESFCAKISHRVIICEEERFQQIESLDIKKTLVLPNIPETPNCDVLKKERVCGSFTLSYVGVLSEGRGIEDLLKAVSEHPNIKLNIAGFGVLSNIVEEYSIKYDNINFFGKVGYDSAIAIQLNSDFICAFYYTSVPNHIYAAPNKFYESLYLDVPVVTNSGTFFSDKVSRMKTGVVIAEGKESICNFLSDIEEYLSQDFENKDIWDNKYKDFVNSFMINYFEGF